MFVVSTAFAGGGDCCAHMTGNEAKGACAATFAKLDLSAEQKVKMETLAAECDKGGCNKETMAKMEASARRVLTEAQFAAWTAECSGRMGEKTQS